MFRRLLIAVCLVVWCALSLQAQEDFRKQYEDFRKGAASEYRAFTDTVNAAFARAIGTDWIKYELEEGNTRQIRPEPETLPVAEGIPATFTVVQVSEAVDTLSSQWPPTTEAVSWMGREQDKALSKEIRFLFYGAEQIVAVPKEYGTFHPKGISEKDVAAFWEALSRYDYNIILADCAKSRDLCGYNDWAVLEWTQALAHALFPDNIHSEQTVFMIFLLNQYGLMTRMARSGDTLIGLFSAMQSVYSRKYVVLDTYPFYLTGAALPASEIFTYNASLMKPARPLDLRVRAPLTLGTPDACRTVTKESSLFNTSIDLPVNRQLMCFYDAYPQTDVYVYARACPERRFAAALEAGLKKQLKGMAPAEAVEKLLAFVQTEFRYQTDAEQFGREKPFFPEENFVYPSNDCEDRAALFAYLVRTLTGCATVLLEYPDHICTAVKLPGERKGDHVVIGGENYYVCDPSYIGASVGMSMNKYKNLAVKVYAL